MGGLGLIDPTDSWKTGRTRGLPGTATVYDPNASGFSGALGIVPGYSAQRTLAGPAAQLLGLPAQLLGAGTDAPPMLSKIFSGAGIGLLNGLVAGLIIGWLGKSARKGAFIGAAAGTAIGGVVGALR